MLELRLPPPPQGSIGWHVYVTRPPNPEEIADRIDREDWEQLCDEVTEDLGVYATPHTPPR